MRLALLLALHACSDAFMLASTPRSRVVTAFGGHWSLSETAPASARRHATVRSDLRDEEQFTAADARPDMLKSIMDAAKSFQAACRAVVTVLYWCLNVCVTLATVTLGATHTFWHHSTTYEGRYSHPSVPVATLASAKRPVTCTGCAVVVQRATCGRPHHQ